MQTKIKSCVRAVLVLGSGFLAAFPATAADEPRYPAYDFSPSVVYQDADLIGKPAAAQAGTVETHTPDPKYPAAYFNPTVIQRAEAQAAAPAAEPVPQHDPKYPAAYFAPSVIHPAN